MEDEISKTGNKSRDQKKEKAILVSVTTQSGDKVKESLDELMALAVSNNLEVVDSVTQRIKKINPRFLIGKGRLSELVLKCIQKGAELLIFDNELKSISNKKNVLNISLELLQPKLERLEEKRKLLEIRKGFEDELLWANRYKLQDEIKKLKGQISSHLDSITNLKMDVKNAKSGVSEKEKELVQVRDDIFDLKTQSPPIIPDYSRFIK